MSGESKLDALLQDWPAPATGDDAAWEARADAIVKKAMSAARQDETAIAALVSAPSLPREANEPGGQQLGTSAGEMKMSDDQSGSGNGGPTSVAPKKRLSLKEIAERASQSGMGRASAPPTSTPVPGARASIPSITTPVPSAGPPSASSTPLPRPSASALRTPLPGRPSEASKDDSGVVDLHTIRENATAQQKAAAEKAKPASESLFEEEEQKAAAAKPAAKLAPVAAPAKKGSGGAIAGVAIAIIGLAAAFAVYKSSRPAATPSAASPESPKAVAAAPAATEAPAADTAAPEAPAPEATASPDSVSSPEAVANNGARPAPVGGPLPPGKPGAAPEPAKPGATAAPQATSAPGTPGDLASEMAKAAGAPKDGASQAAEPASGPGKSSKSSSVPEQPPQGSVSAAVGSVMGGAKACVAGADDVSRAQITFNSSGAVSNVSVSGWASGKGAAGCIKAALKGANVGPFSKPTFTVGVTIRP